MAERRMFSKQIIDSDVFLDMPLSTQALYFHLSMRADDDGFINNPKNPSVTSIQMICNFRVVNSELIFYTLMISLGYNEQTTKS